MIRFLKIMKSWVLWLILFVFMFVITIVTNVNKATKMRTYKTTIKEQKAKIDDMATRTAEVQCTVELNIKSNKNGILIIDADQQASKIADEIKKRLK